MFVYIVWDKEADEIITIHKSREGARRAVVDFLRHAYTAKEWDEFAGNHHMSAEGLARTMLCTEMYYHEFNVEVETVAVEE